MKVRSSNGKRLARRCFGGESRNFAKRPSPRRPNHCLCRRNVGACWQSSGPAPGNCKTCWGKVGGRLFTAGETEEGRRGRSKPQRERRGKEARKEGGKILGEEGKIEGWWAGGRGGFLGMSATMASVTSRRPTMEVAFSKAPEVTLDIRMTSPLENLSWWRGLLAAFYCPAQLNHLAQHDCLG